MLNGFLALLFLALPARAAEMVPVLYRDFSGGINDNADPVNIALNESPSALNVVIDDPAGSFKPRNGFSLCGDLPSANTPTALFEYFKVDGTRRLIVSDNTNYYETADCVTWTTIVGGLSSTAKPTFTIARNKLWVTNKSTHVFTWDGTTRTPLDARSGTPNPQPPQCSYLTFWKERVWCARTDSNPSGIAFSALTDSSGNDLNPSTGSAAWPATNLIQVDQDGGSPLYGMTAYRDNLYAFKNNGIWKILFNNDFDISVVKTLSSVGCRFHDSIKELDGILYFPGPDGIYAFDGDQSIRISDNVLNKFQQLKQPLVNELFKLWTSESDFTAGTLVRISTSLEINSLRLQDELFDDFADGNHTADPAWTITQGAAGFAITDNALTYSNSSLEGGIVATRGNFDGVWQASIKMGNAGADYVKFHFMKQGNDPLTSSKGYMLRICLSLPACNGIDLIRDAGSGTETVLGSASAPDTSAHTYRIEKASGSFSVYKNGNRIITATDNSPFNVGGYTGFSFYNIGDVRKIDDIYIGMKTSATITGDIFNAVTVSSWSTFMVTQNSNSGTLTYEVRVGTNSGAVESKSFSSIVPGSLISGTTSDVRIQWRGTFSASSQAALSPQIDDVTVNYTQGGSQSNTIYGGVWKNRYWLSASSESANNNIVFAKSKSPSTAFMFYDHQIGPMVQYNDLFYAGASTHSAIYRLDYGTNDNKKPLYWYWQSRDETFGIPHNLKRLMEIIVDFRGGNAINAKVGFSVDDGETFTDSSVNMTASGRNSKRLFVNSSWDTSYRFRVSDAAIDEGATILGIASYAIPMSLRR